MKSWIGSEMLRLSFEFTQGTCSWVVTVFTASQKKPYRDCLKFHICSHVCFTGFLAHKNLIQNQLFFMNFCHTPLLCAKFDKSKSHIQGILVVPALCLHCTDTNTFRKWHCACFAQELPIVLSLCRKILVDLSLPELNLNCVITMTSVTWPTLLSLRSWQPITSEKAATAIHIRCNHSANSVVNTLSILLQLATVEFKFGCCTLMLVFWLRDRWDQVFTLLNCKDRDILIINIRLQLEKDFHREINVVIEECSHMFRMLLRLPSAAIPPFLTPSFGNWLQHLEKIVWNSESDVV